MSTVYLVRHGTHSLLEHRLVGRTSGVHLSEEGSRQAQGVAERLAGAQIEAIYSSPLERARETAAPLAQRLGLEVNVREDLNEIEMGAWSYCTMEELKADPTWKLWNGCRTCTRPPDGETILQVQARMVGAIEELRHRHETIAVFSHGDPIRSALAFYAGLHLDMCHRLVIDPGSVTTIRVNDWGPEVVRVNA